MQTFLAKRFAEAKARNPSYSLRAFAKRIGVNPATFSRVLNGERGVSAKLASLICDRLHLDPQERSEVLSSYPTRRIKGTSAETAPGHLLLTADQFRVIGDWYHYGILSLVRTRGFRPDISWISGRLGVPKQEISTAVKRLRRLGLLETKPDGSWARKHPKLRTTDDVASVSLQKSHLSNLELAKETLLHRGVNERDFTAMTMPLDPDLLPRAKEAIRKFQDELASILESKPGTEVYKLCIQLFPLTQTETKGKKS